ncbi:SCO2583/SCO2584 N-terminal domain-containing protein [Streptacidiphilus sp. PAMC 29251]
MPGEPDTNMPQAGVPDIFAGLVLDEAFVLAALIHEPSAEERLKALRSSGARRRGRAAVTVPKHYERDLAGRPVVGITRRGRYQAVPGRWQRVVARVMLVVIGMLAVLVAAAAVYRGTSSSGQPVPGSSSGAGRSSSGSSAAGVPR